LLSWAAAAFNLSLKTAAKWLRRYRALGLSGLSDASSRPAPHLVRNRFESIGRVEVQRIGIHGQ
jgi:transposase